jgi:hypothetical protein
MTLLVCPICGKAWGGTMCPIDVVDLVPDDQLPPAYRAADDVARPGSTTDATPLTGHDACAAQSGASAGASAATSPAPEALTQCWSCGAPVPDTGNTCCAMCAQPLAPPHLVLSFADGQVALCRDQHTPLGRDPAESPRSHLFSTRENVSRLHATVGVDHDGNAWIRDEWSCNGTFVNDEEIPPRPPTPLADGDRVRLGADVRADVRIYSTGGVIAR